MAVRQKIPIDFCIVNIIVLHLHLTAHNLLFYLPSLLLNLDTCADKVLDTKHLPKFPAQQEFLGKRLTFLRLNFVFHFAREGSGQRNQWWSRKIKQSDLQFLVLVFSAARLKVERYNESSLLSSSSLSSGVLPHPRAWLHDYDAHKRPCFQITYWVSALPTGTRRTWTTTSQRWPCDTCLRTSGV